MTICFYGDCFDKTGEFSHITPITVAEATERFKRVHMERGIVRSIMGRWQLEGSTHAERIVVDKMIERVTKVVEIRLLRSVMNEEA